MSGSNSEETGSAQQRSRFSQISSLFTSVRTTITILFLLAGASIIGTVIPQDVPVEQLRQLAPSFYSRVVIILDLHAVYRSWWFMLLLLLLSMNLLGCLLKRVTQIPGEWKDESEKSSFKFTLSDRRAIGELKTLVTNAVRPILGAPSREVHGSDTPALIWTKGRVHLLGFPFIHVAIIVILIGGLIGLLFGIKGNIQIREGETGTEYTVQPSGAVMSLPFTVAVDKFTLERYPAAQPKKSRGEGQPKETRGEGQPKEYRSDVRLLKNGREVLKDSIRVNSPLTYEGISLYQSDYRALGVKEVTLRVLEPGGKAVEVVARPGAETPLPGGQSMKLLRLDPMSQTRGPWVEIGVRTRGQDGGTIRLYRDEAEPAKVGDLGIQFVGYRPLYATGLQIGYDPGTWLVWVGSGFLIMGFFLTLFTNQRRLRIDIRRNGQSSEVVVSGRSKQLRKEFRQKVEEKLREALKG
jgi:cytochrome c biogenesis protein